jgi:glycosyltransferase involved in cell wall biosynthesis
MPTVSVIILSHNNAAYLAQAIESALNQTHKPLEILVVDDSTDDSPGIVRRYEASSPGVVKLLQVEKCNVSKARNIGLNSAAGELLSFLDADDAWLPDKLEKQIALLDRHPDAVGAYANYFDFVRDLDDRQRHVPKPGSDAPSLRDVLMMQNVQSSTALFRRSMLGDTRFDPNYPDGEDTIFACELRLKGPWRLVDEPLVAKRIHPNQASAGYRHQFRNVHTRLQWVRKRRHQIGEELSQQLIDEISRGLMGAIESCYWRREIDEVRWMREEALHIIPEHYQRSFISQVKLYPRWVYRLRDLLGRKRQAS